MRSEIQAYNFRYWMFISRICVAVAICVGSGITTNGQIALSALNPSQLEEFSRVGDRSVQTMADRIFSKDRLLVDSFKRKFTLKYGVNISNMNFNRGYPHPGALIASSWRSGLMLGLSWQIPLIDRLSIKQEYCLSQMQGAHASWGARYSFIYVSLPLLLKYRLSRKLSLLCGPQFDLLVIAREFEGNRSSDITRKTEARSVGVAGGVGYIFARKIILGVRFMRGLNNIGIPRKFSTTEFKYELVQVSTEFIL